MRLLAGLFSEDSGFLQPDDCAFVSLVMPVWVFRGNIRCYVRSAHCECSVEHPSDKREAGAVSNVCIPFCPDKA